LTANKLVVIVGPTAVGKTSVALAVAEKLRTEIVSADSRQIYKELGIGTAKPTQVELERVRHHFIGTRSILEAYDAGQYSREALDKIHQLFEAHPVVVMCGGSGLYVKGVCEGFDPMPEIPAGLREEIMAYYKEKGLAWLQEQVGKNDPDYFATVDQKNPQRLVRALELYQATGVPVSTFRKKKKVMHEFAIQKIGLELNRDELYDRIDRRMEGMIEAGLFEEATQLYPLKDLQALQTVGYQEIFGYFDERYDREETIRLLKKNSRNYAKRQLTWFKKDKEVSWFSPDQLAEILGLALEQNG
jgi:tRNA dimethylallyltransferase